MLKNKALFGTAALVVFVAGLVAGKSRTKADAAGSLYYKNASNVCTLITQFASPVNAFTTGGTGSQATIRTAGGGTGVLLYATAGCSKQVHFHL